MPLPTTADGQFWAAKAEALSLHMLDKDATIDRLQQSASGLHARLQSWAGKPGGAVQPLAQVHQDMVRVHTFLEQEQIRLRGWQDRLSTVVATTSACVARVDTLLAEPPRTGHGIGAGAGGGDGGGSDSADSTAKAAALKAELEQLQLQREADANYIHTLKQQMRDVLQSRDELQSKLTASDRRHREMESAVTELSLLMQLEK